MFLLWAKTNAYVLIINSEGFQFIYVCMTYSGKKQEREARKNLRRYEFFK